MRTFDVVDEKLAEADFFLTEIEGAEEHFNRVRFLFSAFVSAARSVTFALQGSLKDAPSFSGWYEHEQSKLRQDPLARFFHDCRTDAQHLGLNPVMGGSWGPKGSLYRFGQPETDRHRYVPSEDVLSCCRTYMRTICGIVDRAYTDFGLLIDPDQIYTPEGLAALALSLEDLEEQLGLPRGWTDIPWDKGNKAAHRLALLRRNIPGSGIKPLLAQHLGRELTYPMGPFQAPRIE